MSARTRRAQARPTPPERHRPEEDAARVPPYIDATPAKPGAGAADVSLTKAAAEAAGRNADTGPQSRRLEAAVETTQVIPAFIDNRLRAAAHLLRSHGWHRIDLVGPDGQLDIVAAMATAAGANIADHTAYQTFHLMPETGHLAKTVVAAYPDFASWLEHGGDGVAVYRWWDAEVAADPDGVLGLLDRAANSYQATGACRASR